MIWAPRQTGKTFALVRKFVETRNSVFMCTHRGMKHEINNLLVRLGCPDRRRDVHTVSGDMLRGRRVEYIFIDEIDGYSGSLNDLWQALAPTNGRLIAVSTPHSVRLAGTYDRIFHSEYTLNQDGITIWREPESQPIVTIHVFDYFENEKEVFII